MSAFDSLLGVMYWTSREDLEAMLQKSGALRKEIRENVGHTPGGGLDDGGEGALVEERRLRMANLKWSRLSPENRQKLLAEAAKAGVDVEDFQREMDLEAPI